MTLLLPLALACAGETVDTAGTGSLPDETGEIVVTYDTSTYTLETGLSADTSGTEPESTLLLSQTGAWTLGPAGGPWTTISGDLVVLETYIESDREGCSTTYAVTGTVSEGGCESCAYALELTFTSSVGNPAPCRESDLPQLNEERVYGWAPDEETVYLNYYNSGAWLPWYDATLEGDTIHVQWESVIGVVEGT